MISLNAHAKLNLWLNITGKRSDGYHLLNSLFAFTEFGDQITLTDSNELTLSINGPFANALSKYEPSNNLAYRAVCLLQEVYGVSQNVKIELTKNIPICAGIGGGSADAAAVLTGLNKLWRLELPMTTLASLALKLGADVPACLYSTPLLVSGVGEEIMPVTLPIQTMFVLLVNPNKPLSTPSVFQKLNYQAETKSKVNYQALPTLNTQKDVLTLLKNQTNDLEPAACEILPLIRQILSEINGFKNCLLARMSGSGATCFGLFETLNDACNAQEIYLKNHPNHWAKATQLLM